MITSRKPCAARISSQSIVRRGMLAAAATMLVGSGTTSIAKPRSPARIDWPTLRHPIGKDAAMEARIAAIVDTMTLRQKIGQMTQPDIRSVTPDEVRTYYIGSVLNGGGAWPGGKKHAAPAEWVALAEAYRQASLSTDMAIKVPIIWGTDAVHGHNNVYATTLFPHNIGLGAAHDPLLVERIARQTALQVRATGITWAFAPTVAVVQSPRWGRTYESYSSDPALVRSYAYHFVQGLQGDLTGPGAVMGSVKHFLGDGGTFTGIDQGETRATRSQLIATHGAGYYGAIEAGVQTVMISYSSWKDTGTGKTAGKMHGNRELITDVLKGRLGFDGLVVSDWNAIEQVSGCTRTHCPQAVNAGIDLFMVPDDWKAFIDETVGDVEAGRIPMSRIDDAVTRILRVKMRSGLFARAPLPSDVAAAALNGPEVRALAREAAAKSLVLLKNARPGLLPLRRNARVLLVGDSADRMIAQLGGWSLTWQGNQTDNSDFPQGDTMLAALKATLRDGGKVDYSPDGRGLDTKGYDVVIAVLGEKSYAEMKGDVRIPETLRHSDRYPRDLAALKAVAGKGVPVISVLFSGRPVYANDLINLSDAFVAAWLPGTEGQGITDVLFRNSNGLVNRGFSGRLSFDWPGSPCPEGVRRSVLFARGYGLSSGRAGATRRLPEDRIATCPALQE